MSTASERTYVYRAVDGSSRIMTVVLPQEYTRAPDRIKLPGQPVPELSEMSEFVFDSNRTDRLRVRMIVESETNEHELLTLMDMIDDDTHRNYLRKYVKEIREKTGHGSGE